MALLLWRFLSVSERRRFWLAVSGLLLPPTVIVLALDLDPDGDTAALVTVIWFVTCLILYYRLGWMTIFPVGMWQRIGGRWRRATTSRGNRTWIAACLLSAPLLLVVALFNGWSLEDVILTWTLACLWSYAALRAIRWTQRGSRL